MITPEERDRERALFDAERKRVPELFERAPMTDSPEFLRWIGIEESDVKLPLGYLKYMPQDFIVEEILPSEETITAEPGSAEPNLTAEGLTYYADLVKLGVDTLAAKHELAHVLGIDEKGVSYAGIKDRLALTAQRLSIRGLEDPQKFAAVNAENFFLKNIVRGKGAIANGDLKGNRFIITVRTDHVLSAEEKERIKTKAEELKTDGFWNFFHFQRFGTPRLLSHWLGLLLLKGEYEETVKTFITYPTARELPYFKKIREELLPLWGNWSALKEKLDQFPYHFQHERAFVDHLLKSPGDFLGALKELPDQIRLWMYAYDCFLFNRKLSSLIKEGEVPMRLPLVTSFNPKDWEPYLSYLEADKVKLPSGSYRDFPFIRVESRAWPTLQKVEIHSVEFAESAVVFAFSLPKGSYATAFLANFFTLVSGLPAPAGIWTGSLDAKEVAGLGTLEHVLSRFKTVLERRESDLAAAE